MNRPAALPALAALLLLASPAALAENAAATLLPGDRLHGDVRSPGEFDTLSLYLPASSTITVEALAESESAILPGLEVRDPDGALLDLAAYATPGPKGVGVKVKKAPAGPKGGVFTFTVLATQGTAGKYSFRCTAKMPSKFAASLSLAAATGGELPFDAPSGSKLQYKVTPAKGTPDGTFAMGGLRDPADAVAPLAELSGKKIALGQDGTWALLVDNQGAAAASAEVSAKLALPKASKRKLYLSPLGFGEAPKVSSVDPKKVLDDRVATGVAVAGAHFDPAASVRLEKKNQESIPAANLVVAGDGSLTADFDVKGVKAGDWKLVIGNPSGGTGSKTLKVQSAASTKLPPGAVEGTEVWWLDFDGAAFREDLRRMGLQSSTSPTVSAYAEGAVKSYALRWLRIAYGLEPTSGKLQGGAVPVSFVLEEPPSVVGAVGSAYDRLGIGGEAAAGAPSSNPNYNWGNGPLDAGNAAYDDVHPDVASDLGLRTRVLAPAGTAVPAYNLAFSPLQSQPLTANDAQFFFTDFDAADGAEGTRYRQIVLAVQTAGREIAAHVAHFTARSMGTADGASGLSSVPMKVGEYSALVNYAFSAAETAAMTAAVRPGIPGTSKVLRANYFPYSKTADYLLPPAYTQIAYAQAFSIGGGRPERTSGDLAFVGVGGGIPQGFSVSLDGNLTGTAPLRNPDNTLYAGVFRFTIRMEDTVSNEVYYFAHRLNLLVDVNNPGLAPGEIPIAQQLNSQVINTP